MGKNTNIAWCDHTFNPWIGCQKVSAGCDHCYAEQLMDVRYKRVQWGPHGERVRTSKSTWQNPVRWSKNAAAFRAQHGRRQRVFCASLADVFDNKAPDGAREDLFHLIEDTPNLDWLLLTKRPENMRRMLPWLGGLIEKPWPNVWLGTTCEDQAAYNRRWPILRDIPAAVRFISYEPAIGPLKLPPTVELMSHGRKGLHWLICGGESGKGYRPMPEEWADSIRFDCGLHGVAFFMKQMAGLKPIPYRLQVREFPEVK